MPATPFEQFPGNYEESVQVSHGIDPRVGLRKPSPKRTLNERFLKIRKELSSRRIPTYRRNCVGRV